MKSEDAAPLLCAGITTFNALRYSGAHAGDLVSQYWASEAWAASACTCRQDGIQDRGDRTRRRQGAARQKAGSAQDYIDSTAQDAAQELTSSPAARR